MVYTVEQGAQAELCLSPQIHSSLGLRAEAITTYLTSTSLTQIPALHLWADRFASQLEASADPGQAAREDHGLTHIPGRQNIAIQEAWVPEMFRQKQIHPAWEQLCQ